jgi:hypothetical protein
MIRVGYIAGGPNPSRVLQLAVLAHKARVIWKRGKAVEKVIGPLDLRHPAKPGTRNACCGMPKHDLERGPADVETGNHAQDSNRLHLSHANRLGETANR